MDNENIKVISSIFFNQELTVKSGNYTKLKPNMSDSNSIKKGISYFNKLNNLDHIQAVIVKDNTILAIEDHKDPTRIPQGSSKDPARIQQKDPTRIHDGPKMACSVLAFRNFVVGFLALLVEILVAVW